jgi:hypothetical protein
MAVIAAEIAGVVFLANTLRDAKRASAASKGGAPQASRPEGRFLRVHGPHVWLKGVGTPSAPGRTVCAAAYGDVAALADALRSRETTVVSVNNELFDAHRDSVKIMTLAFQGALPTETFPERACFFEVSYHASTETLPASLTTTGSTTNGRNTFFIITF